MREQDARAAPRLRFSKEEMQPESLEHLSAKTKAARRKAAKPRPTAKPGKRPGMERPHADPFPGGKQTDNAAERPLPVQEAGSEENEAIQEEALSISKPDAARNTLEDRPQKARLQTGQKKSAPVALRFDAAPGRRTKKSAIDQKDHRLARTAAKPVKAATHSIKEETEAQLSKYEQDNTGLQAAHTTEQAGSSALHTGKQIHELRQNRLRHQEEKKAQTVSAHGLTFGDTKAGAEAAASGGSNPMSRKYQRKNIQKDYRAAKAGKKTGKAAGKMGKQAAEKAASVSEKAVEYVGKKKHLLVILLLGGMLIFIIQGLSACSPLLEAGMGALTLGTYPAEEANVWQAEQYYADLEWELRDEMQRYELYHPGYDEYVVDAQEIWHDPYALIALISAYNNGEEWTLDDAIPIMQMFFDWQYEKTETVTTEQRYHTPPPISWSRPNGILSAPTAKSSAPGSPPAITTP